ATPSTKSSPVLARPPVFKSSASPKPHAFTLWKEFASTPDTARHNFMLRIAENVRELKAELASFNRGADRAAELDRKLAFLQMKLATAYEQFNLHHALAQSAEEIDELFGVDISARTRCVEGVRLPPAAEAHVAAALREWHTRIADTPWSKQVGATLSEEAELMARRDQLRVNIEKKKRQLEAISKLKTDDRLPRCINREDAEKLLADEMEKVNINSEQDNEDLKSEISTPPVSPTPSPDRDSWSECEQSDEFLDSI
ncbi:hypothetical protein PFISCL1PPCAC_12196, partial [Pristionchus fissidentatus]